MRKIYPAPADEVRVCEICEQPFTCGKREWARNFRRRRTCGITCGHKLEARNRTRLTEQSCPYCHQVFKPRVSKGKYCSRACANKNTAGKPARYIPPRTERIEVHCPQCQKTHLKRPKEVGWGSRFCSRSCYRLFRSKQGLGKCFPYVGTNDFYLSAAWSKLKRMLKKRDAYTCQACQHAFHPTSPGMIVHHIRPRELFHTHGAALHLLADDPQNLVTLCRTCHQKTHAGQFPQFLDLTPYKPEQLQLIA